MYRCAGQLTRSGQNDIGVYMHARIFVDYLLMLVVTWCTGIEEDVRIQDGEEITAWAEDSLALLCKMLPERQRDVRV